MERLEQHHPIADNTRSMREYCIRSTYMLMLVGIYASPLGAVRQVKAADLNQWGAWTPCTHAPPSRGWYLVEGGYVDGIEGELSSAVLPAFYAPDENEYLPLDGEFYAPRIWMHLPWFPEVWEAAEAKFERGKWESA